MQTVYHNSTMLRDKKCAANILRNIANKSILYAQQLETRHIKLYKPDELVMRQSVDGAYANRARMKSRFCYMFMVSHAVKMVTDYDILCILKHGYNIQNVGSKQLEHKLADIMLPRSLKRVDACAIQHGKTITLETVGDKDIEWTKIVSGLNGTAKQTICIKIDDINHVLGKVYDCFTIAKTKVPANLRSRCGISVNFADHFHRSMHRSLLSKPNSFCWDDMVAILKHY